VRAISNNDALARLVRHSGPFQWVMWECECGRGCRELVTLMLRDFDDRRARGQAVSAADHEAARAA
jgi:hypothetical protein